MPDYGARMADRAIRTVDRKISRIYSLARKELREKLDDFVKKHEAREKIMQQKLNDGLISQQKYDNWHSGQVFMEKQWQKKMEQAIQVMTTSNQQAITAIHEKQLDVFAENFNYGAFQTESLTGISFDIYNTQAVVELTRSNPKILPKWRVDEPKDYKWNYKKLKNSITQGIIQGESIDKIADRLSKNLASQNMNKMRMFARTGITEAQNAGRMEVMHESQKKGIKVKKKWLATMDRRTRDAHRHLDGKEAEVDEPFDSELGKIMFPGDPDASLGNVCNCRCTLQYVYPDFADLLKGDVRRAYGEYTDKEGKEHRFSFLTDDPEAYQKWKAGKVASGKIMSGRYGKAVSTIAKPYKKSVVDTIKDAPENAKKVWSKYRKELFEPVYNGTISDPAHFSHRDGRVHFINQQQAFGKSTYQEENVCFFHEYAHNIDWLANGKMLGKTFSSEYRNGLFRKTIHKEVEENLRQYYKKTNPKADLWWEKDGFEYLLGVSKQPGATSLASNLANYFQVAKVNMDRDSYKKVRRMIFDAGDDENTLKRIWDVYLTKNGEVMKYFTADRNSYVEMAKRNTYLTVNNAKSFASWAKTQYNDYAISDISDMYDSYFEPKFGLHKEMGYGHSKGYFGTAKYPSTGVSQEAFAEMFSATVTQNKSLNVIKQHFPQSYKLFEEMMEEMAK